MKPKQSESSGRSGAHICIYHKYIYIYIHINHMQYNFVLYDYVFYVK